MTLLLQTPELPSRKDPIEIASPLGGYEGHDIAVIMISDMVPGDTEKEGQLMYWDRVNLKWVPGAQNVLISDQQRQNCLIKGEWAYVRDDSRPRHKVPVFHNGLIRTALVVDPINESGVPDEWDNAAEIYVNNTATGVYVELDLSWAGATASVGEQIIIKWFRDAGRAAAVELAYPFDKLGAWRPINLGGGGKGSVARVTVSANAATQATPQLGQCIRMVRDATTGNYKDTDTSNFPFYNMAPEAVTAPDTIIVGPMFGDIVTDWYCIVHPCWPPPAS